MNDDNEDDYDDYSWDDDDYNDGSYRDDYSHNFLGPRPVHVHPVSLHGYLPVQWHPHPSFGLSGRYQPMAGYNSLSSGLYQHPGSFSPILSALMDLQYHHPARHDSQRYHGYPPHHQHYHYNSRLAYNLGDKTYDRDDEYYAHNNYKDYRDDEYYAHNNYKDYRDDEYYAHNNYKDHGDDGANDYSHHADDDPDDHGDDMGDDNHSMNEDEYYDSMEEPYYTDSHDDPHYHSHLDRYQEDDHYNRQHQGRESHEVDEQSAWLYPYFKYPPR